MGHSDHRDWAKQCGGDWGLAGRREVGKQAWAEPCLGTLGGGRAGQRLGCVGHGQETGGQEARGAGWDEGPRGCRGRDKAEGVRDQGQTGRDRAGNWHWRDRE